MKTILAAAFLLSCFSSPTSAANPRDHKYFHEDIYDPFFVLDKEKPGMYRPQRPGNNASAFRVHKSSQTYRVFILGGGPMHGGYNGVLHGSWMGRHDLQHALTQALPSMTVEVINCGMTGYDSYREALVEKEVLTYSPDAIIFISGHNDFSIFHSRPAPKALIRLENQFSGWPRLKELLRLLEPIQPQSDNLNRLLEEFSNNFRGNLRQAKKLGIKTVAVSSPVNYRDYLPVSIPTRTLWSSQSFLAGWIPYLKSDFSGARRFWLRSIHSLSGDEAKVKPYMLFYIGRCNEQLGMFEDARLYYKQAFAENPAGTRRWLDAIRDISAEEGVLWTDLDGSFQRRALPRMPGMSMFNDDVHWSRLYNAQVSLEIMDTLRRDLELPNLHWNTDRLKKLRMQWETMLQTGIDPDKDVDPEMHSRAILFYAIANFNNKNDGLSWKSLLWLEALYPRHKILFHQPKALFEFIQALSNERLKSEFDQPAALRHAPLTPSPALVYWHLGEVMLRQKEYARASENLSLALKLDQNLSEPLLSLGLARSLAGDKDGSRRVLLQAYRRGLSKQAQMLMDLLKIDDISLQLKKAETFMEAGDRSGALKALIRAENMDPTDAELRKMLTMFYKLNFFKEGINIIKKLLPKKDQDLSFILMAAEMATNADRKDLTLEALRQAEKLHPTRQQSLQIITSYRYFKEHFLESEILSRLARENHKEVNLWMALAEAAARAGRRNLVLESLSRAEKLNPNHAQSRQIADYYQSFKEYRKKINILTRLAEKSSPPRISLWLELAEAASRSEEKASALIAISNARKLNPNPSELHQLAMLCQNLKEYSQSKVILDLLIEKNEKSAVYYKDRGILHYKMGMPKEALRDLTAALHHEPGLLSASLTLASIYIENGAENKALHIYNRALQTQPSANEKNLRRLIEEDRRRLLSKETRAPR